MKEVLAPLVKEKSLEYILQHYPSLRQFYNASEAELAQVPGIGRTKAKELVAIFKLTRELLDGTRNSEEPLRSPEEVYQHFKSMALLEQENMVAVYLNSKNKIIDHVIVSVGTINSSLVHPREFFAPGVRLKACSAIAIHNHPSGDCNPSKEDLDVTKRLKEAGEILGIPLLDHIIIAGDNFLSLRQKGLA